MSFPAAWRKGCKPSRTLVTHVQVSNLQSSRRVDSSKDNRGETSSTTAGVPSSPSGTHNSGPVKQFKPQDRPFQVEAPARWTVAFELDWSRVGRPPKGVDLRSFRGKLKAPANNDQLPRLDALVVVEGFNDCLAVHRAVRCPVFVLGGGYTLADEMRPELEFLGALAAAGHLPSRVVIFMDPDRQGRLFRTHLDDILARAAGALPAPASAPQAASAVAPAGPAAKALGKATLEPRSPRAGRPGPSSTTLGAPLLQQGSQQRSGQGQPPAGPSGTPQDGLVVRHAFLRVELGTSDGSSKYHEAGNVGVEHAAPSTIRACLKRARRGFGAARKEFNQEELRTAGLVGSWDSKEVAGPRLRRERFCRALGIDDVGTGKGLVNALNRFFTREEYAAALQAAESLS